MAGSVDVVGVAWLGSEAAMVDFVERHGLTFPSLRDDTGELFAHFGVPGQPAWVFVRPDGTATTNLGAMEPAALRTALDDLVPA